MPADPNKRLEERIYRAVDIRIHSDERVMKLSKPPPSGKGLWYELLFGEQTTIIPGLFKVGEAAFAEQLGWSLKEFRRCWKEIDDSGLTVKADWTARLVWVPNALKHNAPRNPKQILHWRRTWQLLPSCPLKEEARLFIELYLKQSKESFLEAFREVSGLCIGREPCNQEAVSSKQKEKKEVSAPGHESNSQDPVDNSGLEGLTDADRVQVRRLLAAGKGSEATALLAQARTRGAA